MALRRRCAMIVALAVWLPSGRALAQGGPRRSATLTWARATTAQQCVGQLGLEEDVKARLGYDPFTRAGPAEIVFEGTVWGDSPGFRSELVIRDAAGKALGQRKFSSREVSCKSLGDIVAVAIAVAIDPDATGPMPDAATDSTPPPASPAPPANAAAPAAPSASSSPSARASVFVGASRGLLPSLAPESALRWLARVGAVAEVGAGALFSTESREGGVGFGRSGLSVDACVAPLAHARALRWCGAVHVGLVHVFVHARALTPVEVGSFPWVGVETGPAFVIPLIAPVELELRALGIVPLTRKRALVVGQREPLWEQSPVGARADIGLGVRF